MLATMSPDGHRVPLWLNMLDTGLVVPVIQGYTYVRTYVHTLTHTNIGFTSSKDQTAVCDFSSKRPDAHCKIPLHIR